MAKEYVNRLSKEKRERLFEYINTEVVIRQGYMRHGFSIGDIAKKYDVHPQDLSAVVAYYFNENFSQLLQRFRVNKVCERLRQRSQANVSCELIGLKCGFSNRQSLYNAFRRIMGMSPAEYRNKQLSDK